MAKPKAESIQQDPSITNDPGTLIPCEYLGIPVHSAVCHQAHMVQGVGTVVQLNTSKIPGIKMHLKDQWLFCEVKNKKFAIPATNLTGVNF